MAKAFEQVIGIIPKEADGFSQVLDVLVNFDVVSECGTAIDIFTAAGTALMALFFCMEAFTYCAAIDFKLCSYGHHCGHPLRNKRNVPF